MLLGDTGVYAGTQGYPLFTMSSLPAAPWRAGCRRQARPGTELVAHSHGCLVEPDGIEPTTSSLQS
jgi:hypothetical protein